MFLIYKPQFHMPT